MTTSRAQNALAAILGAVKMRSPATRDLVEALKAKRETGLPLAPPFIKVRSSSMLP